MFALLEEETMENETCFKEFYRAGNRQRFGGGSI